PSRAGQLGQLLGLPEHAERDLSLRVDRNQVSLRLRKAEHDFVDAMANHGTDELAILVETVFVNPDSIHFELFLEVGQHRVVDREIRLYDPAAGRLLGDTSIAFSAEFLRVIFEFLAGVERAAEATRIESVDRTRQAFVRLDSATTVDRPAGVGAL